MCRFNERRTELTTSAHAEHATEQLGGVSSADSFIGTRAQPRVLKSPRAARLVRAITDTVTSNTEDPELI